MKKVDEGVELFDEIYEKVYTAEQQSQKEKYEVELKKEIKKLQRLRDQIKSWISGTEVKDKDGLLEYRRLIETKMEAFKVVEKETKTKTFSKEGLARADKLDPEEQKKEETIQWMGEVIEQLQTLIDEKDLEVVKLSAGKGKKTNKSQIEEYNHHLLSHKFHMSKLEGIMRLVRNDRIPADQVDELKEDLEYYIDSHQEDDYMMAYDEDGFYESLGLDELDIVNVDRVTQANTPATRKKDDDATSASSGSKVEKNSKKTPAATGMIPLTIGRARSAKADKEKGPTSSNEATPTKIGRSNSGISATNGGGGINAPAVVGPTPTPKPPASPPGAGGASMAAVLRRESEERARAAQLLAQQQEQAALQQQQQAAEQLRQQQLQKQQQQHAETQRLQQAETLRQQLEAQQKAIAVAAQQAEALKRQQMMMEQRQAAAQMQQQQQDAAAKQKLLQQQAQAAPQQVAQAQQQNVINNGLSSLSLSNAIGPSSASTAIASTGIATSNTDSTERYLHALNESFLQIPTSTETERAKSYTPRNPYPAAPSCYPSTPSPILDNPAVFEKLGTDALFFIFYYAQGTYQQYLAARELKKQSWRYHKKYMTWFQRHEEPKVTTGDYEQGTYVYFDYETGWCQRIKSDFRFEYSFLEDSLSV
jgi:CCR4-NOT transcription complex subunit 3